MYSYFRHCYSIDGIDRNVNDCLVIGMRGVTIDDVQPENQLGYLYIKQHNPEHELRLDLMPEWEGELA